MASAWWGLHIAPTPPPDIDLELWDRSLTTIETWNPTALLLTHFGTVASARAHVARFRKVLERTGEIVRESLDPGGSDEEGAAAFVEPSCAPRPGGGSRSDEAAALELAAPFEQIWAGLARYWRKRCQPDSVVSEARRAAVSHVWPARS